MVCGPTKARTVGKTSSGQVSCKKRIGLEACCVVSVLTTADSMEEVLVRPETFLRRRRDGCDPRWRRHRIRCRCSTMLRKALG